MDSLKPDPPDNEMEPSDQDGFPKPRLLEQVRRAIAARHYSPLTERAYVGWIRRYIHFHGIRHQDEMESAEVVEFLSDLAVNGGVASDTSNREFELVLNTSRARFEEHCVRQSSRG